MSFALASSRPLFLPALAAACLAAAGAPRVSAQTPGTLDPNFSGSGAAGFSIYTQVFGAYSGTPALLVGGDRGGLAFLRVSNGSPTFIDGSGASTTGFDFAKADFGDPSNRIIYTVVPEAVAQPDGTHNLLVGGIFGKNATQIKDKQPGQNIFRILPLGGIDSTFNPGRGADNYVTSITPLADGGMIVAGMFGQFNKEEHQHIVRLDNGGQIVDASVFDPKLNFDATILSVATQTYGIVSPAQPQFVVAGIFTNVNGASHNRLVRLNYDGTIDASFNPAFDDRTTVVVTQPDGKILVGGDFTNVNGEDHRHIVRLNFDGSVDHTFVASVTVRPSDFVNPAAVYVIKLLDDGSMYVGGNFTQVDGVTRNYLARVSATGELDPAFDPGKTIINAVQSLSVLEGQVYVGETLSKRPTGMGPYQSSLIRLYAEAADVSLKVQRPNAVAQTNTQGEIKLIRNSVAGSTGPLTVYIQVSGDAQLLGKQKDYKISAPSLAPVDKNAGLYSITFPAGNTLTDSTARLVRIRIVAKQKDAEEAGVHTATLTVVDNLNVPAGTSNYSVGASGSVTISN